MPDSSTTSGFPAGAAMVIVDMAVFPASPRAARVAGRTVAVDGGFQL